ncbi:MAG: winged helix-turn-helix domain-containing protein [Terriglobia bacterium]|nr:winged helix-turn-helix domain-containing protein [Terriglobia bacterium]
MGQAVLHPASAEDFFVGEWLVQPSLGVLTRRPSSTHLEPKTMQVLVCLAAHSGAVVSKDELLSAVWPNTFVTEHVLTQAIWQLRQAFNGTEIIQTIPRRGYRLIATVRAAAAESTPSIAVLPLENLSADPEQEYFADGMTEALISALAQIGALRVISRTSVMRYKRMGKSVPEIATELKVNHIIEGSVMRSGDHVRVSVQLIAAANDQHLWAKAYDRELRDVLALQDEVARAIASQIRVTITPEEDARLTRPRHVEPAAQELYLRGLYLQSRTTEQALRASIENFKQAIAIDPAYALAHIALARSFSWLSLDVVAAIPPIEAEKTIRPAVMRGLELDPNLPEAHQMLGWTRLICDWDWKGAEEAYRQALALNPNYPLGWVSLSWIHLVHRRYEEAIAAFRKAAILDPLALFQQALFGSTLAVVGRIAESIEQLQKTIRLEPNYFFPYSLMGGILSLVERHQEAIVAAEKGVQLCGDPVPSAYLAFVYARAGRPDEARHILGDLLELAKTRYVPPSLASAILLALGQHEDALDYLEKSQQLHESFMLLIHLSPQWKPLYGNPRFQQIIRNMNYPTD